jgi:gamma-tubulin complex component 3
MPSWANRYLLLGQGDFIIHYMAMVEKDLDRPARTLHVHHFSSQLEAAVRATNAQSVDPTVPRLLPL